MSNMAPHSLAMEDDTEPRNVKLKHKVPRCVLDSFDNLVIEDALKQSKASVVILKHADESLQNYSGTQLPNDVTYIVSRLVNGLMSSRLRAREGFYTALQALLQLHPSTVRFAFQTIKEKCCDNKAPNRQEAKEQIIAELLSYGALVRSGQAHCNPEIRSKIITRLSQMRRMKTYFDTLATQFLVNLMEKCDGADSYKDDFNHLENEVSKSLEELSPCQLWLRLIMLKKQKHKAPAWLTSTLAPKNYPVIGRIVMQTAADLPKVHPLLEEVVSSLVSCEDTGGSPLVNFWVSGLAPYLESPSPSRLQILFNVLQLIFPKLISGADVTAVVSDSLVALLLTTVSRHDKDISYAARGLASALLQLVTANQDETSDVQLAVLRALLVPPGSVRFDQLTGTKLLAQMKTHFTVTTIKGIAKTLVMIMKRQIEYVKPLDQSYAAHSLKNLVMHPKMMCEEHLNWRTKQVIVLMKAAFFTPGDDVHLQGFRDAFFKALSHHAGRIKEYRVMLLSIASVSHQELQSCETTGTSPLSVEAKTLWSEVYDKLCSLQKKEVMTIANEVLQVLYCQMALHLFIDSVGAKDIIDELSLCHKEVMKMEKKKKKSKGGKVEEGPQWVEVVTELLLSLLTHEKSLFRSVAQGVFWLMSPLVTHTALTLIVDVLDPAKSSELISKEEDEKESEDEDEEGMEAEEEGYDERMVIDEESDLLNEDDADDDSEDDDEEEEEEEEDEPGDGDMNLFEVKKKMLAVIGDIDRDIDMDSVPEEELNNMNNQLGALMAEFLSRQKKKKNKKGAIENLPKDEKSLMHFRTRVCDLIEVYIKKASNMDIIVALVNPLLKALHTANQDKRQQELQCRLRHTIHTLAKVRKFSSTGEATIDGLINTLDNFFAIASDMPEIFTAVVQECYSFLFHCGWQLLGEDSHKPDNPLIKTLVNHMEKLFMQNTITVKVHAFSEPCSFDCVGLWIIIKLMAKYAFDPEIKVYRRSQALHVLQKLYQNKALMSQIGEDETQTEGELAKKTINTLNSFQKTPESMNAQYVSNLFFLVCVIHKSHKLNGTHKSFNWEEIGTAVLGIRQRISKKTLKSFRRQYNSLQQALKLPKMVCNMKTSEKAPQVNTTALPSENSIECTLEEGLEDQQKEGNILNLEIETEDRVMNGKTDKKTKKSRKSKQGQILSIEKNEDVAVQKTEKGTTEKQKKKKRKHESVLEAEIKELVNESVDSHDRIKKKKKLKT